MKSKLSIVAKRIQEYTKENLFTSHEFSFSCLMRLFRFIILIIFIPGLIFSDEIINDIVAIVGDVPITYMDLKAEMDKTRAAKNFDRRNKESQALDKLIENAIVDAVLKEEVISIPESQIDEIVKRNMQENGFTDEKKFEAVLRQQMNMSLDDYKHEILNNMKIQQIAQLKISIPQPREEEIRKWYNLHLKELGQKYSLRIIKKKFNPANAKDELAVNQMMNQARTEAIANFAQAAVKYSDDPSASNGGLLGLYRFDELMAKDPIMANIAYKLSAGEVSMVFVSQDSYYLLKVDSMSPVSLEEAAPIIIQRIYRDKMGEAFTEWIQNKRKSSALIILLKGYQEMH